MALFRAGKTGRVRITANNLAMREWSLKDRADKLDTTNFESFGYETNLTGVRGGDWSLQANWDVEKNFSIDPPGLFPRDDGQLMELYPRIADGKFINIPRWTCFESTITTSVRGMVEFNSSGCTDGIFYPIVGTV